MKTCHMNGERSPLSPLWNCFRAAVISEGRQVKAFISENISLVIHPDEIISRRAIALLEHHAFSHGLRVVDAIIAASALETVSSLATANVRHYRVIGLLNLIQFKS